MGASKQLQSRVTPSQTDRILAGVVPTLIFQMMLMRTQLWVCRCIWKEKLFWGGKKASGDKMQLEKLECRDRVESVAGADLG